MVSKQANQRETLASNRVGTMIFLILLGIFMTTLTIIGWIMIKPFETDEVVDEPEVVVEPEPEPEPEPVPKLPVRVDLQPVVDAWTASVGGNRSVLIYDVERDEMIGTYNANESYNTASLYKLFVVYEGYRRLQSGEWQADAAAGATGRTILECLDLAIRESYSPCAETLWGLIGHDALDEIIVRDFGIVNSDISRLISNPQDIMKIMQIFYEHKDVTREDLVARMKDSFLNQPTTTYNWRQGLPSGFTRANVYNKVGWDYNPSGQYWNIYHDAAIVEFPELDRHLIVVVMTNRVPFERIKELGSKIENEFYK